MSSNSSFSSCSLISILLGLSGRKGRLLRKLLNLSLIETAGFSVSADVSIVFSSMSIFVLLSGSFDSVVVVEEEPREFGWNLVLVLVLLLKGFFLPSVLKMEGLSLRLFNNPSNVGLVETS